MSVPAPPAETAVAAPVPAPVRPSIVVDTPSEPAVEAPKITERLRSPVIDVPVSASDARAAQAVPVLIPAPPQAGPPGPAAGAGTAGGTAVTAAAGAAPGDASGTAATPRRAPAPVFVLPPPSDPYRYRPVPRQRSLSEMANEQLRRGKPTDKLADGMDEAGVPDCVRAGRTETFAGLLAAPVLAARALQGKCK